MPERTERACTACGLVKPLTEFHRLITGRDGRRAECKDCACARVNRMYKPRARPPVMAICPQCGEGFTYQPTTGRIRVYCSRKCSAVHAEELKRQRNAGREPRRCACGSTDVSGVGTPVCPACRKDPRPANQAKERRRTLARYGITEAEYDRLVKQQRNRCAVCKTTKVGGPPTRNRYWHIDHDHVTGQVRGLLCARCNLAIGQLQDDPKVIRAALRYVEQHRQTQLFGAAM